MSSILHLKIVAIQSETPDSKTFILHSDEQVIYRAGQFLTFLFERNGSELRRSYSLSSSPDADTFLSVTLKRTINGEISAWWIDKAKVGDYVNALHPAGMFTIEWQNEPRDIFLVAAGSGITPIYSLLKSALVKEPQSRLILIYANSNPTSAIFLQKLQVLQKLHPQRIIIELLFSNNQSLLQARLGTYNLQAIIRAQLRCQLQEAVVYTCGPYYFMLMVQITCLTMGFIKENVRKEIFDITEPVVAKKYFDTVDRTITLLYNNKKNILKVPYKQSILETALQNGIELPYSCKAGKCSTCRCRVLTGKIWMHYNEVLTDADEANGFALTCTGHPASEDVIIEVDEA